MMMYNMKKNFLNNCKHTFKKLKNRKKICFFIIEFEIFFQISKIVTKSVLDVRTNVKIVGESCYCCRLKKSILAC